MMTGDDMTLVREFAASQSDAAFAELVQRHVGLVHSAALRQAGNAHLAGDITQAVFIILARKAASLGPKTVLSAWLYRATRYAASDALKTRRRRQIREQEAFMQSNLNGGGDVSSPTGDEETWSQLAPLLDDAMNQLGEKDRAALVLRYFENKTAGEIAVALRMQEEAAQKRVARALEKLRRLFTKQGINSPADAITGAISANSIQVAPVGLAAAVTAVAKGAAASTSTLTLVKGVLKIMAWTKAKMAAVTGMVLILAAGTTVVAVKYHNHHSYKKLPMTPENMRIFQQQSSKLVNDAKFATLDCLLFADDHTNQLPNSFAQLNAWQHRTKLSDKDWEFVASGNKDSFTNPDTTIHFLERKPRQSPDRTFARVYATVNGRVFLVTSPTDDFSAPEKEQGFLIQQAKN